MTWKPDYTTVAALKSDLQIPADDTADDVQLGRWVTSASRAVDDWAHRQFGQTAAPELRRYPALWDRHENAWVAEVDDVQDVTGLVVAYGSTEIEADEDDGYELHPLNAIAEGMAYTHLHLTSLGAGAPSMPWAPTGRRPPRVTVTARWGWTAVPVPVVQATLMQCARLSARRSSPFGVAGSPAQGSELRLLEKLDVDAALVMHGYRRDWWAA